MPRRRSLLTTLAALLPLPALAQAGFPDRAIRLVVPYAPGGTTDLFGRAVAPRMAERLGQPVVVENKAGAGGSVAAAEVARARPDGHTIMVGSNGPITVNPLIQANPGYDPLRDLEPIGLGLQVPLVIAVRMDSGIRTVAEFIAAAKRPGGLAAGSTGTGSSNHLALELFNAAAGVSLVNVPYRGSGPMIIDLLGGTLPAMFDQITTAMPLARDGRARMLAVTSAARSAALPEVPTLAESGVRDAEMTTFMGIVAPAGLPAPVRDALARALGAALADPGVRQQLGGLGAEVAEGTLATPEGFAAFIRADLERTRRAVRLAGLKPE